MLAPIGAAALLCTVCTAATAAAATGTAGSPPTSHHLDAFALKVAAYRNLWAPITSDDLPRTGVTRPDYWAPNVSAAGVVAASLERESLSAELSALRGTDTAFEEWSPQDQADYWAISSVLARAFWELHVLQPQLTDPNFYVLQGPGAVWDALVRGPPSWTPRRTGNPMSKATPEHVIAQARHTCPPTARLVLSSQRQWPRWPRPRMHHRPCSNP